MAGREVNECHYHIWVRPRGSRRMMYRWAEPYRHASSAWRAASKALDGDIERIQVMQCWHKECAPQIGKGSGRRPKK